MNINSLMCNKRFIFVVINVNKIPRVEVLYPFYLSIHNVVSCFIRYAVIFLASYTGLALNKECLVSTAA